MENRKEIREPKNIRVRLKDGEDVYPAQISNISKLGMSVRTSHMFPTFKVIDILVKIAQVVIPIKGSVRWGNRLSGDIPEEQFEIGFSLHNPPRQYTKHFE